MWAKQKGFSLAQLQAGKGIGIEKGVEEFIEKGEEERGMEGHHEFHCNSIAVA